MTYGNTALPEGTPDRPLVTFALFAYNQETYIREAVEGAFSQTYEPLEIILSDDCSSDSTFEIMKEMAEAYRGPHLVKLRKSEVNRGLGIHIRDVVRDSHGCYVVVAAGDDISHSHRTTSLIYLMESEKAQFATSNYNNMNDSGVIFEHNVSTDSTEHYVWELIDAVPDYFASGAVAAYRKIFLEGALFAARKAVDTGNVYYEDILFAAYAVAINELPSNYKQGPLVDYRVNPSSISNFKATGERYLVEVAILQKEIFRSSARIATLDAILEIATQYLDLSKKLKNERIYLDKRRSKIEFRSSSLNIFTRISSFFLVRNREELRIASARLFGQKILIATRLLINRAQRER